MGENNGGYHSGDADASKRTLLGVGLASLLGTAGTARPVAAQEEALAAHEPSVQVSGELANEAPAASRHTTSKILRLDPAYPPMPGSRRRWIVLQVALGALAVSIGIGLKARGTTADATPVEAAEVSRSATVSSGAAPEATPAATTPVTAQAAAPAVDPFKPAATVVVDPIKPAATAAVDPISSSVEAKRDADAATPRAVDLGDGSCSAFVDATTVGEVSVDDQAVGPTPVTVTGLWCGRQTIVRINRPGFDAWTKTVLTQEGRASRIRAALRRHVPSPAATAPAATSTPAGARNVASEAPAAAPSNGVGMKTALTNLFAPTEGLLAISSKVPCEIFVDGKSTGLMTPQHRMSLPAGSHEIKLVSASRRVNKSVTIQITADKPTSLNQDLLK